MSQTPATPPQVAEQHPLTLKGTLLRTCLGLICVFSDETHEAYASVHRYW